MVARHVIKGRCLTWIAAARSTTIHGKSLNELADSHHHSALLFLEQVRLLLLGILEYINLLAHLHELVVDIVRLRLCRLQLLAHILFERLHIVLYLLLVHALH